MENASSGSKPSSLQQFYLLAVRLLTPLHIGAGEGESEVDKPVIKDIFGLPYIPASSLKGAIKRLPYFYYLKNNTIYSIFGSSPNVNPSVAVVGLLDAIPLCFLARELEKVYCYVSFLPHFLHFLDYCRIAGLLSEQELNKLVIPNRGKPLVFPESEFIGRNEIIINERKFGKPEQLKDWDKVQELLRKIGKIFGLEDFVKRFVVLPETPEAVAALRSSCIIYTRNSLELLVKQVRSGLLWSEEYVPYNSIFVSVVILERQRLGAVLEKISENDIKNELEKQFNELEKKLRNSEPVYLFLGGLESIGKGFAEIRSIK
ncbi:MAG: type III-B CRISPR module RAMP protein Cmr4 [bacterium]|nr:type III-B CRISPR module RAMP protein Cmr4 [bacterium]